MRTELEQNPPAIMGVESGDVARRLSISSSMLSMQCRAAACWTLRHTKLWERSPAGAKTQQPGSGSGRQRYRHGMKRRGGACPGTVLHDQKVSAVQAWVLRMGCTAWYSDMTSTLKSIARRGMGTTVRLSFAVSCWWAPRDLAPEKRPRTSSFESTHIWIVYDDPAGLFEALLARCWRGDRPMR